MQYKGFKMTSIKGDPKDHLANERTFLAWVRTCIGIMAFGFVVEKFALFIRQITYFLDKSTVHPSHQISSGYASIVGIALVLIGTILCLFAFLDYKRVEKQISEASYYPSKTLNILLTFTVFSTGLILIIYLLKGSAF
jgi:putative membrane protein